MNNTEWLIEFNDNSFFRISETEFYKNNQKNYKAFNKNESYKGMKEMDFCYCNDNHIDLIECKEVNHIDKRKLKDNLRLKALHSSALLKTALSINDDSIREILKKFEKNYEHNTELKIYIIFKIFNAKDKAVIPDVIKSIENIIKNSLISPLGRMWNINEVHVLDYKMAKEKLKYIK